MNRKHYLGLALASLAWMLPGKAGAQGKVFKGENYSITFTDAGWDTATSSAILAKYKGISGMASLGAQQSADLPNLDSLTEAFADSLGGAIRKDSSGVKTIAAFQVHWQKYKYDSLPKLSSLVSKAAGFTVNLKNGSFRVYYLNYGGYAFTIACLSILPGMDGPYADVERAIATLKLGNLAGIRDIARASGRDLWIRDGKLGGAWLRTHAPLAIEGFDARGTLLGAAVPAGEGAWDLPSSPGMLFLRVRAADGSSLRLPINP